MSADLYYVYSTTIVVTAFTRPTVRPTASIADNVSSSTSSSAPKKYIGVAVGGAIGGFCLACIVGCAVFWFWRRRNTWWPKDEENNTVVDPATGIRTTQPPSRSTSSTKNTEPKSYEYGQYGSSDIKNLMYSPPQRPASAAQSMHERAISPIPQSRSHSPFNTMSMGGVRPSFEGTPLPSSSNMMMDYNLARAYNSAMMDPPMSPTSPASLPRNDYSFEKRSVDLASVSSHSSHIYSQSSHHHQYYTYPVPSHSGHSHSSHHGHQPPRPPRQKPSSVVQSQPGPSSQRPKTAPSVLPSAVSHSPSSWFTNPHNHVRSKSSQSHRSSSRQSTHSQTVNNPRFFVDDSSTPSPPPSPVSTRLVIANPDVDLNSITTQAV